MNTEETQDCITTIMIAVNSIAGKMDIEDDHIGSYLCDVINDNLVKLWEETLDK